MKGDRTAKGLSDNTRQALADAWPLAQAMGGPMGAALLAAAMREVSAQTIDLRGDAIDVEFRVVEPEQLPDGAKLLPEGES